LLLVVGCQLTAFTEERLDLLRRVEQRHFWFDGRRRLVMRWLRLQTAPSRVLDVGCGTGTFTAYLRSRGVSAYGVDQLASGNLAPLVRADATRLPIAPSSCDVILLLDVLEHTDDVAVLREARRVLRDDGVAIVLVPAWPWLWSARDERAGHLRRYTRPALTAAVERAGLRIERWTFYQSLLFPLFAWSRWRVRRRAAHLDVEDMPSPPLNAVLRAITRTEVGLGRWIRWPIGSTLAAVIRKHAAASPRGI
jgi:SAM-dependent methyltransferase